MKSEDLNPKAKEAHARSLVNNGMAIFKAVLLTILVLPATLIVKAALSPSEDNISVIGSLELMPSGTFLTFLILISLGMVAAAYFYQTGLKLLHETEQKI